MELHDRLLISTAPMLQIMGRISVPRPQKMPLYVHPRSPDAVGGTYSYRHRSVGLLVIVSVIFLIMMAILFLLG